MSVISNNLLATPEGYQISRSVRLRSSASAYLNGVISSTGNQRTLTLSAWVKRGALGASLFNLLGNGAGSVDYIGFNSDSLRVSFAGGTSAVQTTAVYRDPSSWYHVVVAIDTTQATAANRVLVWVNGVAVTAFSTASYPAQNATTSYNTSGTGMLLGQVASGNYFDGYLTEVNFIDGQALTPSSFGETNAVTGVWQPKKYTGTYGTNGFYLNFSDNSNNTATTIGKDYSGNGNNWTPNNISVTAGVTYDSMIDVPTPYADGGNGRGNYAVMNPLDRGGGTVADGNLSITNNTANHFYSRHSMQLPTSGKWYWEVTGTWDSNSRNGLGVLASSTVLNSYPWGTAQSFGWYLGSNTSNWYWSNNGSLGFNIIPSSPAVFQICYDADNGTIYAGINNTFYSSAGASSGNPSTLTNPTSSSVPAGLFPTTGVYQSGSMVVNHGQRPFTYTPPTGFKALNTQNLPTPTISNGANYMAATTFTGNASTQSISNAVNGVSFQPDLVWLKSRSNANNHTIYDVLRGVDNILYPNLTNAAVAGSGNLTAFNSNGFTLGASENSNDNSGESSVGWQWKANGAAVTNTSGSITSTVSVGATQGFSVVTFTGTLSAATVGHGLGVAPSLIIAKRRNGVQDWLVGSTALGWTKALNLNLTNAAATTSTAWNNTAPTSSVFSISTFFTANTYVAYCFSEVAGYSKFGSYTGNGSADGPFVFCGFRPRFIMVKSSTSVQDWKLLDTSRNSYNSTDSLLGANISAAEDTNAAYNFDILSNGFKIRNTFGYANTSGQTYIFMAFAENPTKFSLAR